MKHFLLLLVFGFCSTFLLGQQSYSNNNTAQASSQRIDFRVFPNPATDYIQVSDNDIVQEVVVYNLVGRQVKSFSYSAGESFYIGNLPQGMYLVRLIGAENKVLTTKRVNIR